MKGSIELGSASCCNYCQDRSADYMYTDLRFDGVDSQEVTYLYLCTECDKDEIVPEDFKFKILLEEGKHIKSL